MKLTVAYRVSMVQNLLWFGQMPPQGRGVRIRLNVVTEAGFLAEVGEKMLNSACFHFCLMYTYVSEQC